ncbi:hypothetical protein AncyloWKF20_05535 [Ancylobacter sp. WKF20]|uniref:hypothetical protein n=1 Tax=Ancylobacter sp. WKF20 TaxID=3039801 RepID=UPI0024342296|nr:hypothetical protein [Ancylobacter sp. WKF20]WGD31287.1 hypothetical protein AncyloWKF20_05535 [Ancylobacter sp. WKF20]
MKYQGLWAMVLRNADAGSGGGNAPAGDAGAGGNAGAGHAGAAAAAAAAAAAGAGAADPWKRDFLPESMYGATPEETFSKVADAWKGLREAESRRPQPGKSADEYVLDVSKNEKLQPYFANADTDPFVKLAKDVAHEIGLPKDQFTGFVTKLFEKAIDGKMMGPLYSPEAEARSLGERLAPGKSWAEAKPIVQKAHADALGFTEVLGKQLALTDGAKSLLGALVDEADGVELVNALAGAMKPVPGFALPGVKGGDTGGWTQAKLDAAVADERYSPLSPKYDKGFRAQVDAAFQQFHGN